MSVSPKRRLAILAAHGGVCHYCGDAASHVDHIIPLTSGGSDDLGNLTACCIPCNKRKRDFRLSADAEREAQAKAEAMRPKVLALEQSSKVIRDVRSAKINIMLTPEEVSLIDQEMHNERCRSMSTFARQLIREALIARGKLAA